MSLFKELAKELIDKNPPEPPKDYDVEKLKKKAQIRESPKHTEKATCKNCGHEIYYQFDRWEHFTRRYRASGFAYTTLKCFAPGDVPISWYVNGEQVKVCGCESPVPTSGVSADKEEG